MKQFLLVFAFVTCTLFSYAQNGHFTLSAGTGQNVTKYVLSNLEYGIKSSTIPVHLEAGYQFNKRLQVAVSYNYSGATTKDMDVVDFLGNVLYTYQYDAKVSSIMVKGNYFYVSTDKFQLGSGLAMGMVNVKVSATTNPSNNTAPVSDYEGGFGIHFNLLEARYYFNDHVGVYGNVGYMNQGMYGLGVIVKL